MKFDYEKGNPVFDEFLKEVCKKIRGRKHRDEVREELLDHLAENFERNTALGMSEEDAAAAAVKRMGDSTEIAEQFGEVYSCSLCSQTKKSIDSLFFGLLFTIIHFELFPGAGIISTAIGSLLILRCFFRIHKYNKTVNTAFKLYLALCGWRIAAECISYNFIFEDMKLYIMLISQTLSFIAFAVLFSGLKKKCSEYETDTSPKPHLLRWWLIYSVLMTLGALFSDEGNSDGAVWIYIALIAAIVLFRNIFKVRAILASEDSPSVSVRQDMKAKEKALFALTAALLIVLLPLASQFFSSVRQPAAEPYIKADSEYSADEVTAVRERCKELGLPEKVLNDLPDSEIMLYKDAFFIYNDSENGTVSDENIKIDAYVIRLGEDENGRRDRIRILYCVDSFDGQRVHFRDGFFFYPQGDKLCYFNKTGANALNLILTEKNGSTYRCKPIFDKADYSLYSSGGCEFAFLRASQNRRAYFAVTSALIYPRDTLMNDMPLYYHKKVPFCLNFSNSLEYYEARIGDTSMFGSVSDPTYSRSSLIFLFELHPELVYDDLPAEQNE